MTTKKRRLEESSSKHQQVLLADHLLQEMMGGRKYVQQEELTRDCLLDWLLRTKRGMLVETFDVSVGLLSGMNFGVKLDHSVNNSVKALKEGIESQAGIARQDQEIFLVEDAAEEEASMDDSGKISAPCSVVVLVKVPVAWVWDIESPLFRDRVFELSGPDNCITTKIDRDMDRDNCLLVSGPVVTTSTGKHTISFKMINGFAMLGVVKEDVSCDQSYCRGDNDQGWFMYTYDGGLCGNNKNDDDCAGKIEPGQVLTVQVDTDAGNLKFWLDGKPHGPGYTSGVAGPLRFAMAVYRTAYSVQIVPTPELQ